MKGEEPVTFKEGDAVNPRWRLSRLTDTAAEFQNTKFQDLRHRIEAVDGQSGRQTAPSNEF
jgi:hypothetical protein